MTSGTKILGTGLVSMILAMGCSSDTGTTGTDAATGTSAARGVASSAGAWTTGWRSG